VYFFSLYYLPQLLVEKNKRIPFGRNGSFSPFCPGGPFVPGRSPRFLTYARATSFQEQVVFFSSPGPASLLAQRSGCLLWIREEPAFLFFLPARDPVKLLLFQPGSKPALNLHYSFPCQNIWAKHPLFLLNSQGTLVSRGGKDKGNSRLSPFFGFKATECTGHPSSSFFFHPPPPPPRQTLLFLREAAAMYFTFLFFFLSR